MSRVLHISDAAYQTLQTLATEQGHPPEAIVERLIAAARPAGGAYLKTEDWFRHLGVSEERIRRARERADRPDH